MTKSHLTLTGNVCINLHLASGIPMLFLSLFCILYHKIVVVPQKFDLFFLSRRLLACFAILKP